MIYLFTLVLQWEEKDCVVEAYHMVHITTSQVPYMVSIRPLSREEIPPRRILVKTMKHIMW